MLDIGFSELLLLGAVALIVLGPEKLPHAARMAGAWYGRIRRTLANVQAEIANEVHLAEMRQKMNDELAQIRDAKDDFVSGLASDFKDVEHSIYPETLTKQTIQHTDWSQGIKAPMMTSTQRYYFFFVPQSMYHTLIPATPYLPRTMQLTKTTRLSQTALQPEQRPDAAPL